MSECQGVLRRMHQLLTGKVMSRLFINALQATNKCFISVMDMLFQTGGFAYII